MKINHVIFTITIFLVFTPLIQSGTYNIGSYPDIRTDLEKCGRKDRKSTAICDPDKAISHHTRNVVDNILY